MTLTQYLSEVRGRVERATPGPWYPMNNWGREIIDPSKVFGECGVVAQSSVAFIGQNYRANEADIERLDDNLRLIAHCPQDLAKLLEVVEILRSALEHYECSHYDLSNRPCSHDETARQALQRAEEVCGE